MMPPVVVAVAKISASFAESSACSEAKGARSRVVRRMLKAEFMWGMIGRFVDGVGSEADRRDRCTRGFSHHVFLYVEC